MYYKAGASSPYHLHKNGEHFYKKELQL